MAVAAFQVPVEQVEQIPQVSLCPRGHRSVFPSAAMAEQRSQRRRSQSGQTSNTIRSCMSSAGEIHVSGRFVHAGLLHIITAR